MFSIYNVKDMCSITAHYVGDEAVGARVVPNSYDGNPVCVRIASPKWDPGLVMENRFWLGAGSCYPVNKDLPSNAEAGTEC